MVIDMEQNLCTIKDIYDFDKLPIDKKVIFTSRNLSDVKSNIYLKEFRINSLLNFLYTCI